MNNRYNPIAPSGRLTKEIAAVIARAMAARPQERCPGALALMRDLEKALRPLVASDGFSNLKDLAEKVI
jgi:hypothetical protein